MQRWIERRRDGTIAVALQDVERETLHSLLEQLRDLLLADDRNALRRLYPTAYPQHEELEHDYRSLVHDSLLAQRLDTLDAMQATLDRTTLSNDELGSWMTAINSVRLTLGTLLDVGEDDDLPSPEDADFDQRSLYYLLGLLLEQIVEAMFHTVPEEGTETGP